MSCLPDEDNKRDSMLYEECNLEDGHPEWARNSHDSREGLTLARPEPPRSINMLSGSTAIFGNVDLISMSSPHMESKVESLHAGHRELTDDVSGLRECIKSMKVDHERLAQEVAKARDPRKQKDLSNLKNAYKELYKTHEIHCVDENDRIMLSEVDISDFAVNLKISYCSRPEANFRNEAKRYLESLATFTGEAIDISNLVDDKHRITFIRGIAGMGKSVLTKQLIYGWANGDIYQNFKMCVMFECKDLNYFKDHEGAKLEKHEILQEFMESKINYDLGDGEGVLIILDGLDELFDIIERESVIGQLLSRKIYPMCKVILTGRPHIEFKLDDYHNSGGLKTVEIQGLTTEQINLYVEKFCKREDQKLDISRASSASNVPIIHVPQFLNTFCCIANLVKGQHISNSTDLYCWTVFLLLKQHANKHIAGRTRASEIFNKFSQALLSLCEICHNLLAENKIIVEGNIRSFLGDIGKDKEFFESLFVDVSDNITEKYQFKHLSLMEFFSALYICKQDRKTFMEFIKDNLEKGFIEVVSFVCRLITGYAYEGIIKEMLINVAGLTQGINEKQLLNDVIQLLSDCALDKMTKLERSLEIISLFSNKSFNDIELITSIIGKYHVNNFYSYDVTTENICKICIHLENCGWNEDYIRLAFATVQFGWFFVSNIDQLDFIAAKDYFSIVGTDGIWLHNMTTSASAICKKFGTENGYGYCGGLRICDCCFDDEVDACSSYGRSLRWLRIQRCKFKNVNCFINLCNWGLYCYGFRLDDLHIIAEWWERFVQLIEQTKDKGELKMKILIIDGCGKSMTHDMAMRIMQCSVELKIDGEKVYPISRKILRPSSIEPSYLHCLLL